MEVLSICESCLKAKMTKRPFAAKGNRSNEVLELVHSDLYGPMISKLKVALSISLLSLMITQGMDIFI